MFFCLRGLQMWHCGRATVGRSTGATTTMQPLHDTASACPEKLPVMSNLAHWCKNRFTVHFLVKLEKYVKFWRVSRGLEDYQGIQVCRVRQVLKGLSGYEGFVKVRRVCQGMKSLSRYEEVVKVCICRVCQGMHGLSKNDGIVKLWRVCQSMNGLSGYEGLA